MRTPCADLRFLLPFAAETALLRGAGDGWAQELAAAGVRVVEEPPADLLVLAAGDATPRAARGTIALAGARPASRTCRRYAALPSSDDPALVIPLDRPGVASYALETWTFPRSRGRALVKPLLVRTATPALRLRRRSAVRVCGGEAEAAPFLVAAAAGQLGVREPLDWCLVGGQGDALSRGIFHLFEAGANAPRWILKFARARGYDAPFERDECGLRLVADAGGVAATHAPRLVSRFTCDGFAASVETAGLGTQLTGLLESSVGEGRKVRIVEAVAGWLVEVGRETAGPAAAELDRLRERGRDADGALLDGLGAVPGVLTHNDLGCWNVVATSGGEFTVLDWEDARRPGLPLWDLWYFLADALALLERVDAADRLAFFRRLFRGEARTSPALFGWTRRAVSSLGLAHDVVGKLAALCWLAHGRSYAERLAARADAQPWPAERYHEAWLADELLGPGWTAWT